MLTEIESVELLELKEKCLDSYGKPRTDATVDTEDLVRLAELQEKEEAPEPPPKLTVVELKAIAKDKGIKGYANMKEATLIARIEALGDEPEKEDSSFVKGLEAKGYTYLGKNKRGHFFIGPDKKAFMSTDTGKLRCLGNKFGDKLLKSLKK